MSIKIEKLKNNLIILKDKKDRLKHMTAAADSLKREISAEEEELSKKNARNELKPFTY